MRGQKFCDTVIRKLRCDDQIHRKIKFDFSFFGFIHNSSCRVKQIVLHKRFSYLIPLRLQKCKCHTAAYDDLINLLDQIFKSLKLARYLASAYYGYKRSAGIFDHFSEEVDLLAHQETGCSMIFVEKVCYSVNGGVLSVACAKRIIDIDIGKTGKLSGQDLIIGCLTGLKTEVFEQKHFACLQSRSFCFGIRTDHILRKIERLFYLEQSIETLFDHIQRVFFFKPNPFWSARMRSKYNLAVSIYTVTDCRKRSPYSSIIRDISKLIHRNIEITPNKNPLAVNI